MCPKFNVKHRLYSIYSYFTNLAIVNARFHQVVVNTVKLECTIHLLWGKYGAKALHCTLLCIYEVNRYVNLFNMPVNVIVNAFDI